MERHETRRREMDEKTERELERRDDRVERQLRETFDGYLEEERELARELARVRLARRTLVDTVRAGRWYALTGVLSTEDMESLCEVETLSLRESLDRED
jgi:hypothetical protein